LLIFATAALGLSAPAAQADTLYVGSGLYKGTSPTGPSITLLRRDDGSITGRAVTSARCGGWAAYNEVVKLSGRTADGVSFTASGRTRIGGRGPSMRITVSGTLTADAATGNIRIRHRCRTFNQTLALRTPAAPAGAPAVPGPGTLMFGNTSQSASGLPLAVALRVAKNGRVYASWQALANCRRGTHQVYDFTPSRKIAADGSFGGTQSYTIRYKGFSERYRVSFRGRFTADGATGTYTASVRYQDGKNRYVPCRSGRQTWTARP
jgi:hypothetical protein